LKVSDGTNFASKTMTIIVTEKPVTLVADFAADITSGQAPFDIQFTDASKGGAIAWSWNFGDGNKAVEKNPKHTFTTPGDYDAVLTVNDGKGHSDSKHMPITVTQAPPVTPAQPIADFDADRTSGESPLTVQFSDKSKNAVSYEWVFGDGATSTDQSPSHTYTVEGDYSVTLTVTGSGGDKSTSQTIITVSKPQPSNAVINDNNSPLTGNATPLNSP
jgi:PKD repeat protein